MHQRLSWNRFLRTDAERFKIKRDKEVEDDNN